MVLRNIVRTGLALAIAAVLTSAVRADTRPSPAVATKKTAANKATSKNPKSSTKKASSRRKQKGQLAPAPERISEIQQALAKDGSFSSTPNGKWDDSTIEAMKRFQGAHGLNPSGKLDALTLRKLGLGSQTAGVAEPIAPPNSSSRLTSSSSQSARP
jgi:peptidoglycan hydrolase-like protein with peptidoglycan-binding domain